MNDLGQALISLVEDLEPGLLGLISTFCYLLGVVCFVQGCLRLLKHSEDRSHAPPLSGTLLSFLLSAGFVSLPQVLAAAGESLFGTTATASASLGYGTSQGTNYDALLGAVFTIVNIVGLIAFIKGAFVLRAASDGKPGATSGRAFLHMIGGITAWYVVTVIEAVQTTLGITVLKIS